MGTGLHPVAISVVIPTYRRGRILLKTLDLLKASNVTPGEILVVDQTERHPDEVQRALDHLEREGRIRRILVSPPSIPKAMNTGLLAARGDAVLFLDDDIEPGADLVNAHARYHNGEIAAVCGQVLQPGQQPAMSGQARLKPDGLMADLDFAFNGSSPVDIRNIMAGNLSVNRNAGLAIGGFDEQFIGSAYRFETDFARRLIARGYRIRFAPEASLRHLRVSIGGTRSEGDHFFCPTPLHSVGDYYFMLRHGRGGERMRYLARRMTQECINRFYIKHPWLLPRKIVCECRAYRMARGLVKAGPRLIFNRMDANS